MTPKRLTFDTVVAPRVKRIIGELPLRVHKRILFYEPIGLYLRGLHFQKSQWSMSFYVSTFVHPLYAMASARFDEYGGRVPVPGPAYNEGWNCDSEQFDWEFTTLLSETVSPRMSGLTNGRELMRYVDIAEEVAIRLEPSRQNPDWKHPGYGWAALHLGRLDEARENFQNYIDGLERFRERWRLSGPPGAPLEDNHETKNVRIILDLIAHNPDAIPAHCDAVARQAIINAKLEKFWEPTPFRYQPGEP
jgi:hypothetical protein